MKRQRGQFAAPCRRDIGSVVYGSSGSVYGPRFYVTVSLICGDGVNDRQTITFAALSDGYKRFSINSCRVESYCCFNCSHSAQRAMSLIPPGVVPAEDTFSREGSVSFLSSRGKYLHASR